MHRALLLFGVLVACGSRRTPDMPTPAPRPPSACNVDDGWVVLRMRTQCADIRGGWSGYNVYEIRTGPARGKLVIAGYGDGAGGVGGNSNWSIGQVELAETPTGGGWPNQCGALEQDQPGPTYAGRVVTSVEYDDEPTARSALVDYCD